MYQVLQKPAKLPAHVDITAADAAAADVADEDGGYEIAIPTRPPPPVHVSAYEIIE